MRECVGACVYESVRVCLCAYVSAYVFVRLRECVCVCALTYVRMCVHNHLLFLSACMNIIQITAEAPQSQKCERTLTENMKIITVVGHVGSKKSNIKRSNQKIHFQ